MEEELDLLKRDWNKNHNEFKEYSPQQLFAMTKKKSVSIAKWVFIIALLEICFWALLGWFLDYRKMDGAEREVKSHYFIVEDFLRLIEGVSFILPFVFISVLLYINYKIRVEENPRQLMNKILWMRKSIQWYISIFLVQITLVSIIVITDEIAGSYRNNQAIGETIAYTILMGMFMVMLLIPFVLGIKWIYKKLIYGKMLRKLEENYKELSGD